MSTQRVMMSRSSSIVPVLFKGGMDLSSGVHLDALGVSTHLAGGVKFDSIQRNRRGWDSRSVRMTGGAATVDNCSGHRVRGGTRSPALLVPDQQEHEAHDSWDSRLVAHHSCPRLMAGNRPPDRHTRRAGLYATR